MSKMRLAPAISKNGDIVCRQLPVSLEAQSSTGKFIKLSMIARSSVWADPFPMGETVSFLRPQAWIKLPFGLNRWDKTLAARRPTSRGFESAKELNGVQSS